MDTYQPRKSSSHKLRFKNLLLLVVAAGAIGVGGYFYLQSRNSSPADSTAEINDLVGKVGKLILLPAGEVPVLVTIQDKSAINDNLDFFKNAETGDKVLIYRGAKRALIYRPRNNILVNVASVTIDSQNSTGKTAGVTDEKTP